MIFRKRLFKDITTALKDKGLRLIMKILQIGI